MKKTLFTLSLLCGFAGAAAATTLDDAVLTIDDVATHDVTGIGNSYSISALLNVQMLRDAVTNTQGTDVGILLLNGASGSSDAYEFLYSCSANQFVVMNSGTTGQRWSLWKNATPANLGSLSLTNVYSAAVTMTRTGNTSAAYLSLLSTDGTIQTFVSSHDGANDSAMLAALTSVTLTGMAYSAKVFDTCVSQATALAINEEYVPEPATATLSLLALAGLAVRRRRK